MENPILEMKGIVKSFPGVKVLKQVNLSLKKGEIMALMGENGAGKSTLMKILTGIYEYDEGEIVLKGQKVNFKSPKDSNRAGIAIIHQELNLFPNLTAAENIFLEKETAKNKIGLIDWKAMNKKAQVLVDSLGLNFNVKEKVENLSVHHQQLVEILRAVSSDAEIIIMDEPTSALPENEVQNLFVTIRALQKKGVSIIYVSHRMNEIFDICQTVIVLRDGKDICYLDLKETNQQEIIAQMIGKEVRDLYPKLEVEIGEPLLTVKDMSDGHTLNHISFHVRKGEILGLYGLVGSGITECAEALFGLNKLNRGDIFLDLKQLHIQTPADAIKSGIAYVPPDRRREGIVKEMSIKNNISLSIIRQLKRLFLVNEKKEISIAEEYSKKLNIKSSGIHQTVNFLSGGNQQKVVLSKWLVTGPQILILNDPTRGVDVGAKAEIYGLISKLASEGMGIIMISSEMPEVLGMSDRILVFSNGRIVKELMRDEATQNSLLLAASE
ncbi:MAG: sugar transporter ATP-binding protein [Bacilli bacterium]|nr:sugar transporter ATP-binding protein [Bacilli bacterium]